MVWSSRRWLLYRRQQPPAMVSRHCCKPVCSCAAVLMYQRRPVSGACQDNVSLSGLQQNSNDRLAEPRSMCLRSRLSFYAVRVTLLFLPPSFHPPSHRPLTAESRRSEIYCWPCPPKEGHTKRTSSYGQ